MLEAVALPYCTVLLPEPLDAPRGRLFASYRARLGYRWFLGQGVMDEFGTLSSPVWLAPAALIGKMYDFGITFGFRLDPELPVDGGWPPVCIGLDTPAPALPADWEAELADAIRSGVSTVRPAPAIARSRVGPDRLDRFDHGAVTVLETDAPLLPHQLARLCDAARSEFTLAIATGQRTARGRGGRPAGFMVASERRIAALERAVAGAGE